MTETRASALRVARLLVAKSRAGEAIAVLSAHAATGPNDPEGQGLLAEALQIDPSATIARMAFARMEGMAGADAALDAAIGRYTDGALGELEKELVRPAFRRAQVGFNDELKYKGRVYHVQTEDSGLDKPHVITHLFADGGRIIKSTKRSYAEAVTRDDVVPFVRALMKGQQMEMVAGLRNELFDAIIEGQKPGGMEVLEHPPTAGVARVGHKKAAVASAPPPPAAAPRPAVHFRLDVVRSLAGGPDSYEVTSDVTVIGASGEIALPGERFCHRREAVLKWRDGRLSLEDLDGGNGAFVRIRRPVELMIGDEFIIGDQLLRIDKVPVFDRSPGPGPTYCYSSPVRPAAFRVIQLFEGGAEGGCVLARGTTLYIGSAYNDMIIHGDPLVSARHCLLDEQAGAIVLRDLDSRTGVFVRIQGELELYHGDELLIGRTRLALDLNTAALDQR